MDLTEAEDIKKRWQEYTEELYKKKKKKKKIHTLKYQILDKIKCFDLQGSGMVGHLRGETAENQDWNLI